MADENDVTLDQHEEEQARAVEPEILDPESSERQYWRDSATGIVREIWRPGDGDGHMVSDHFDRVGGARTAEERWRFYQISTGPLKLRIKEPPKNVILDDRAVHEILLSDIPKAQLTKRWSHDFSGQGHIRYRRPHRGRPAIKDQDAGDESSRYHSWAPGKSAPYYFTGEKDYVPVIYGKPRPKPMPPQPPADPNARPKQHNQYTPINQLVRNGAESVSKTRGKYRHRINTFLRRTPSPPLVKDRARLFGGQGIGRRAPFRPEHLRQGDGELDVDDGFVMAGDGEGNGGLWVPQDEFDDATAQPDGSFDNDEDFAPSGSGLAKRPAPQQLFSPRPKAPRQMGYIERLAAGIAAQPEERQDGEGEDEDEDENGGISAAPGNATAGLAVVQQLQAELEEAREIVYRQDEEIQTLREQVEELQARVAVERSLQQGG